MWSRCLYRILLWALSPIIITYTAVIAIRQGESIYLKQRFGFGLPELKTQPLWIHCASVGELNTALPLIKSWLETHDDCIIITTTTPSSAKVLRAYTLPRTQHCYLPLDYPGPCRRFFKSIQPRCALILETEIWLNLFSECWRQNIPLYLLNARLSKKTLAYSKLLNSYYQHSLAAVNHIYARSQKDADDYVTLNADKTRISVTGNLKYAGTAESRSIQEASPCSRRYFLAASTHHDEEMTIAAALRAADKKRLLVIVPRHPERGKSIRKQLEQQGFRNIRLRSETKVIDSSTLIYIADTIGELPLWIAHAELVFTGGSLVKRGGHNLLEPAMLGTPQITGPHTENFSEEAQGLKQADGLVQIENADALTATFRDFAISRETYREMARNASRYIAEQNGKQILQCYVDILKQVA